MLTDDLDRYLAYRLATDWRPRSHQAARSVLGRLVAFLHRRGRRRWPSVTAGDLDTYLLHLRALGRSRVTRDHTVWAMRGYFGWLHQRGRILVDVSLAIEPMEDDERPLAPPPLSVDQVRALFDAVGEDGLAALRDRTLLELLYSAGLRCGEAIGLQVDDLDLDAGLVHVRATKTNHPRSVPFGVEGGLAMTARSYLALRREWVHGPDHGALLLGSRGRRLNALMPGRILTALGKRLGFHVHPHALRHAIACHLHAQGVDLRAIQALLGHRDLETTFGTYIRMHDARLRADYDEAMPPLLPLPKDPKPRP